MSGPFAPFALPRDRPASAPTPRVVRPPSATRNAPVTVLVMPGEGIGPEIVGEAVSVLEHVLDGSGLEATVTEHAVGRPAYERSGEWLPAEVRDAADEAARSSPAAILYGATADEPIGILRKRYDLFANLRPVQPLAGLAAISPLQPHRVTGVDLVIVRELVSDVYYGRRREGVDGGLRWAGQEMYYREDEARRVVRVALQLAATRRRRLTFVHKANVIPDVFGLWLDALGDEARSFPEVTVENVLVDTMAMELVLRPSTFDVVVTTNLFGDVLSEIGAAVLGSLGLLPSVSTNSDGFALYEPAGGTAPALAGTGRANPLAAILSVELMLRHTFGEPVVADILRRAIEGALETHRTPDISEPGRAPCTTAALGAAVRDRLDALLSDSMVAPR